MHKFRTHNCNQLNKNNIGSEVKLSGWVHSKRDHGSLIFIDLRDHYGITQCVVDSQNTNLNLDQIASIKLESVLIISGDVVERAVDSQNPNLATGTIEVRIKEFHIESLAEQIPFQVNDKNDNSPEELRLKYRFLDLRKEKTHNNIVLRSQVISFIRQKMVEVGFLEIQTPILTASSPEGARDYLVPARLHPGKFYALPQAPQQFKQLLMVAGFDKYFQIAPCFRDEDLRSDRSPEFYQLDVEMSFVTQEDVFNTIEPVLRSIFEKFGVKKVAEESRFIHIPYEEAMLKYGIDKPDLRNPIIISEATDIFIGSGFSIFTKSIEQGAVIRAIPAPKCANQPRSFFDKMIESAIANGAKGLAYIIFDESGEAKGPIAKFLSPEKLSELKTTANLNNGDAVFFSCGKPKEASKIAGLARIKLGHDLGLIDESIYKFCWIIDFPMYELDEETGKVEFSHNPFSMPQGGLEALNSQDPLTIKAFQYDIVCNGVELCSGAIRNHKPEIMYRAFEVAGYGKEIVEKQFGAMLNAFKFGAPPHGGLAPGIDRIIMLLADEPNIREIIPFPMNGKAQDLMMGAPAQVVSEKQLKELNIELSRKAKENLI